ncbi:MAG: DEAD/DEAH box helicase [Deltaproteobacteria bacterium]|nr:DEAD/DEAH box helicase [Deltaproteobacteria bacterium]
MRLRDYQLECLRTIHRRYRAGVRRQLVCLPTGTGKTVIFAQFPTFFRMKHRMLVLAHREELLDQAAQKLRDANRDLRVDVEQGGRRAAEDANVVVASVATLGRSGSKRLAALDPSQFNLIVVDEAHHASAESWHRVLHHFGVFAEGTRKLVVGFTATPKRTDGAGLETIFEEIVFERDLPTMIAEGYLSPVAAYRVETNVDLSRVRTKMGDFVVSQLSGAVNTEGRNELVVQIQRERLSGRKAVCFCVDVAHALKVAAAFQAAGVAAAAVHGDMPADDRRRALADFREGRVQVLTNCMVLTEGYDEPSIEGIILARPTKSTVLYTQMIGRGTRLHAGKQDVTVVDIVDATRDHSLVTLPGLFGFKDHFDLEGTTTTKFEDILRWVEEKRPWVQVGEATSITDLRHRCRRIDLFGLETPAELARSRYAWLKVGRASYRLPIGGSETLALNRTLLNGWEVTIRSAGGTGQRTTIATETSLPGALRAADAWFEKERPKAVGLATRDSRWRHGHPSDKQLAVLQRFGLEIPKELTRGDASRVIGMLS